VQPEPILNILLCFLFIINICSLFEEKVFWLFFSSFFRAAQVLSLSFFFFPCFLGLHLQHMEVPRLGVKSELQLLPYTMATTTWDLSHICSRHHCSWQCQILNPLSKAKDRTHILMDPSQVVTTEPQ